ncbi:hypothetical protein DFR29_12269 [Tahibacter aquaticus]|uniref:Uncharacterized protein n=1 Tax=Tahibacter aquaticus TaxID=520092 RepID=A0A4R6YLX4_9GAMM|nr:hypothetical protein [Tahibacter aquaticus]TDR38269.1 hypothetical protein DFR29_12269 [Tahibacter aquaticus]
MRPSGDRQRRKSQQTGIGAAAHDVSSRADARYAARMAIPQRVEQDFSE